MFFGRGFIRHDPDGKFLLPLATAKDADPRVKTSRFAGRPSSRILESLEGKKLSGRTTFVFVLAAECLFVGCSPLSNNTSDTNYALAPKEFVYPRQVKGGSPIVLEVGVKVGVSTVPSLSMRKDGGTYDITAAEGSFCECLQPSGFYVGTLNLGAADSQMVYRVIINGEVGSIFDVKCTTDVYDSIFDNTRYSYDVRTFDTLVKADTLSLAAEGIRFDTTITVPLVRNGNGHWQSNFTSSEDSLFVWLSPLGGHQITPFRLTKLDKYRVCILDSTL